MRMMDDDDGDDNVGGDDDDDIGGDDSLILVVLVLMVVFIHTRPLDSCRNWVTHSKRRSCACTSAVTVTRNFPEEVSPRARRGLVLSNGTGRCDLLPLSGELLVV